jgi:outer membrane protein TolC
MCSLFYPFLAGIRPRRRALACALVLTWASATALAQSLNLDAAQCAALAHSARLHGKAAAIDAAQAMSVAAGERPDPVLKAGIDNIPATGAERATLGTESMTMRRIGVMQELTRGDKLRLRSERYQREAERAAAERDALRSDIERDTALAWFDAWFAQAELDLLQARQTSLQDERTAVEASYRGGRARRSELIAIDAELGMLEERRSTVRQRVRAAAIALARWTGSDAVPAPGPLPDLSSPPLDLAQLEQEQGRYPTLQALDRQRALSETEASLAAAARRPDWSVELTFQQRGPAYSNMVSFGVSVPLQWDRKNRQDRELAARLAQASGARDDYEEARRAFVAEQRQGLDLWQTGRERLARYRQVLEPLARERAGAPIGGWRRAG